MTGFLFAAVAYGVVSLAASPAASAQEAFSITGTLWLDEDANGVLEPSEDRLGHRALTLHSNGEQIDRVGADESGRYAFEGLGAGRYTVRVEAGSSYILTYPARAFELPFEATVFLTDSGIDNADFGLHPPYELPHFHGLAWVDAAPAIGPAVRAWIDGVDCTGPYSYVLPPDGHEASFDLSVLSDQLKAGCGSPGDRITFTVDGRRANESATWEARNPAIPLPPLEGSTTLTAGSPFAYFYARLSGNGEQPGSSLWDRWVVALIDGTVCAVVPGGPFGGALIGVPSEEQIPGCGRFGRTVTFAIDGFAVPETLMWQVGERPDIAFTFAPSREAALAGPRFAYFEIDPESNRETVYLDAYVGDVFCGSARGEPNTVLLVPVAPAELAEGCGREGAMVTFTLNGEPFGTPQSWQPGFHGGPGANGDNTPAPGATPPSGNVTPPSVGDAGLKR